MLASAGARLAPLLRRFRSAAYLRAMAAFDPVRWIGAAAPTRLLLQNGRADRDFPLADALARGRADGRLYPAGHTLDARAIADREHWLEGCLA